MADAATYNGDVSISGDLRVGGTVTPAKAKSAILAVASQTYTIPMSAWRVWDNMAAVLPTDGATDDLGIIEGTFNTNAPSLQTDDFGGNAGAVPYYARAEIVLPGDYVAGQSVTIRVHAGMLTTVADQACTVDVEAYKSDEDSTSTGDLYAGAAQSMNSLVFADIDFALTATTLSPGDLLDVRLTVSADDDGNAGVMIGCIGSVQLICGTR